MLNVQMCTNNPQQCGREWVPLVTRKTINAYEESFTANKFAPSHDAQFTLGMTWSALPVSTWTLNGRGGVPARGRKQRYLLTPPLSLYEVSITRQVGCNDKGGGLSTTKGHLNPIY
jgi:hypothetical protein